MEEDIELKLTLGMADRRKSESPPDEESWGEDQQFESRSDPKVTLSQSGCFFSNRSQYRLGIARTINIDTKNNCYTLLAMCKRLNSP